MKCLLCQQAVILMQDQATHSHLFLNGKNQLFSLCWSAQFSRSQESCAALQVRIWFTMGHCCFPSPKFYSLQWIASFTVTEQVGVGGNILSGQFVQGIHFMLLEYIASLPNMLYRVLFFQAIRQSNFCYLPGGLEQPGLCRSIQHS